MTEVRWSKCNDPTSLIAFVIGAATDRQLRLFACACCRRIWNRLTIDIGHRAVIAAESHADGLLSDEALLKERCHAEIVKAAHPITADAAAYSTTWVDTDVNSAYTHIPSLRIALGVDDAATIAAANSSNYDAERSIQADIARDIFGNPFLPMPILSLADNRTIQNFARLAYEERTEDGTLNRHRMYVLADALEINGCRDELVLSHLLEPTGSHYRGCWALDLLLKKR